jgi:nitrate reductase beta subunit
VYYIPPVHVPSRFLRQLFGPGAEQAVKAYRNAASDPDLAGLLGLFGSTERIVPRWRRQGEWVIGAEAGGAEIVRVPLKEPFHIRDAFDRKFNIARVNCP